MPPFISHWKDGITRFHVRNASNNIWHSVNGKRLDTFQTRLLVSQKVIKWTNSDYSCTWLFHCNVSFWFHYYCFVDSAVFFTSSESLHWSHRLLVGYLQFKLMHWKVLLYCIWKGFEAIIMFRGFSDSFIYSLSTKAEPARNRSLTNFLTSTVIMYATRLKVIISLPAFFRL